MIAFLGEAPRSAAPILEARGLTKHFSAGRSFRLWARQGMIHALDDVSFALRAGTIAALVGESGSGKSTAARLLARLYTPTAGTIHFQGDDVTARRNRHRDVLRYRSEVQMIFQDPFGSLNPVKRVAHHLARPLRIHHIVPLRQVDERVEELLTTVGLTPAAAFAQKFPHQLSGGQRQRVAIARALAVQPLVLLADEPISMLDVSIRMGILNLMLELKAQQQLAFLYITHDIASARYVADEVLVLYAGQVVEQGPTEAVLQNPLHPYTRLLLSAVPNPVAALHPHTRLEARGEVPTIVDPQPGCRFAPRCPAVMNQCRVRTPDLREIEPGHWARCHLYEPLAVSASAGSRLRHPRSASS
jgi:peptide/nickel transport system ATP-binding protein